ncbi:XkdW family protein [Gorillibacterium sp. sgz5001074]|uniref:XkdW family protein n=1 Tax=Gorillibacterium sp. sgz5001074 TaxID=3446695 RepID=UPI003F67EB2F
MNIAQAVMYLFEGLQPMVDFEVRDDSDGNGPYIAVWNVLDSDGQPVPQPAEEELLAAWRELNRFDLDSYKLEKKAELQTLFERELNSTFTSTALGDPIDFNYDRSAQERFAKKTALLALNPEDGEPVTWPSRSGFVTMTREQYTDVVKDAAKHESDKAFKLLYAEAYVDAASTMEEVDAVIKMGLV